MGLFSIFKKDSIRSVENGTRTLRIGGGIYSITIPAKYSWEYEEDNMLLFYPKGEEAITIRVTVLCLERTDGKLVTVQDTLLGMAREGNLKNQMFEDGTVLTESLPEQATERNIDLIMQYWCLGRDSNVITFSSTTVLKHKDSEVVMEMKNDLPAIFKSVTKP